jgi:hypothetical protein
VLCIEVGHVFTDVNNNRANCLKKGYKKRSRYCKGVIRELNGYVLFIVAGHIPIKSLERMLLLVYITTGLNALKGVQRRIRYCKGGKKGVEGYMLFIVVVYIPIKSLERMLLLVYITTGANA